MVYNQIAVSTLQQQLPVAVLIRFQIIAPIGRTDFSESFILYVISAVIQATVEQAVYLFNKPNLTL